MKSAEELPPADYERTDAPVPGIVVTAFSLVAALAVVLAASGRIYRMRYANSPTVASDSAEISFRHGPVEQTSIARDWLAQDRNVRGHLTTYEWIDRRAGVVRIPINRAIELIAAESEGNATANGRPRQ